MKRIAEKFTLMAIVALLMGASCDKYEKGEGITGVWRCRENYQVTKFRSHNVSVDRYTQLDSSSYIIYNLYNLGLDVETIVQLKDTVFSVLGTNSDMYFITGRGVWHKATQTLDWEYSVLGQINDPFVSKVFDQP